MALNQLYYSRHEVSKITNLEQYVLAYWDKEFPEVLPKTKNRANRRIYTIRDIKMVLEIKRLLREERLTITQTRERMESYFIPKGQEDLFAGR